MTPSAWVKQAARELGFTSTGIASAGELMVEGGHLREWLARGYAGTMEWMTRTAAGRSNPQAVLDGVRSIVVVSLNYQTPFVHPGDRDTGKISRYAWGDDYHRLMGKRLKALSEQLARCKEGAKTLWYVDTGPVMEKAWAARAGIGWQGKNTMVITPETGSWVFLGVILTTLELEPDQAATDHCGTCTLCLEACPTGALVHPYVLDARLCLSYLTIEHRGRESEDVAGKFEGWIFGCDICQDVCPWNTRFATPSGESAFVPREQHLDPPLEEWSHMSPEEFTERFRGSPVRRARHEGFLRNIARVRGGGP